MNLPPELPLCEPFDDFDLDEVRDLIRTTSLLYDADGLPIGYEATPLFGLEAATLTGRSS